MYNIYYITCSFYKNVALKHSLYYTLCKYDACNHIITQIMLILSFYNL